MSNKIDLAIVEHKIVFSDCGELIGVYRLPEGVCLDGLLLEATHTIIKDDDETEQVQHTMTLTGTTDDPAYISEYDVYEQSSVLERLVEMKQKLRSLANTMRETANIEIPENVTPKSLMR